MALGFFWLSLHPYNPVIFICFSYPGFTLSIMILTLSESYSVSVEILSDANVKHFFTLYGKEIFTS